MDSLVAAHKRHAAGVAGTTATHRYGTVQSVDPANYAAKVTIWPEGVLSGWLPIHSTWIGNGWGMVALPSPGDQVKLVPQEGDAEQLAVAGSEYSTAQMPPQFPAAVGGDPTTITSGEFALVHQSGSGLRLCADGTVFVKGDLHVDGDIYDKHGSLDRLRGHYDAHTHGGVQPGSGNTATPSVLDPE
jgi:phage baseplate assembly protein gpV